MRLLRPQARVRARQADTTHLPLTSGDATEKAVIGSETEFGALLRVTASTLVDIGTGGAVSVIDACANANCPAANAVILDSNFTSNFAFQAGGALYYAGSNTGNLRVWLGWAGLFGEGKAGRQALRQRSSWCLGPAARPLVEASCDRVCSPSILTSFQEHVVGLGRRSLAIPAIYRGTQRASTHQDEVA